MKNSENQYHQILQYYLSCGMKTADVLEQIEYNMNKKLVLEKHSYKNTPATKEGGRYMTYIFDTEKNQRQKITSYSEKGLYQNCMNSIIQLRKNPCSPYILGG